MDCAPSMEALGQNRGQGPPKWKWLSRGKHRAYPAPGDGALEEGRGCICTEQDFTLQGCVLLWRASGSHLRNHPPSQALSVVHQYPEYGVVCLWTEQPISLGWASWPAHRGGPSRGSCRLGSSAHMRSVVMNLRGLCLTFSNTIICFYFPCRRMK